MGTCIFVGSFSGPSIRGRVAVGAPSKRDFAAPLGAAHHRYSAGPFLGPVSVQHLGDEMGSDPRKGD